MEPRPCVSSGRLQVTRKSCFFPRRNSPSALFVVFSTVTPPQKLAPRQIAFADQARVDLAAFYDVNPNLRVQVNVENLLDTLYFPTAHSADELTVAPPINARLTVSARF